jgi:oxaloacetate decarboxylase alpha subunit
VTCRPADLLDPEIDALTADLQAIARERSLPLSDAVIDDVLTYALFPQVGLRFIEHRGDPSAFEPPPDAEAGAPTRASAPAAAAQGERYDVRVNGKLYTVEVAASGALQDVSPAAAQAAAAAQADGEALAAPLAGTVFKVLVAPGEPVRAGQPVLVLEAMKMETDVSAPRDGTVAAVNVREGDEVSVGDSLMRLG